MEIRFKSSEFGGVEIVKAFNKDFKTSTLVEDNNSEFKDGVTGTVKHIHINNAYIIFQDYSNKKSENYTLEITQNKPVFLLQFILNGAVTFSLNKTLSTTFSLNTNMYNLFFIPPSKHTLKHLNPEKKVLNIYFTESFVSSKMGACFIINSKKYQQAKRDNEIYSFFNTGLMINGQLRTIVNEFLNCSFEGITKHSYLESKLTELTLIALASNQSESTTNTLKEDEKKCLASIEKHIRTHLKEDLTIEKLSVLAGFNTSKFKSIFKQVYGMPVFKYITSLRIEKAIHLISNHDYTIAQASYEVGYKNPQHFTVAFKKKLGYLPSQLIN